MMHTSWKSGIIMSRWVVDVVKKSWGSFISCLVAFLWTSFSKVIILHLFELVIWWSLLQQREYPFIKLNNFSFLYCGIWFKAKDKFWTAKSQNDIGQIISRDIFFICCSGEFFDSYFSYLSLGDSEFEGIHQPIQPSNSFSNRNLYNNGKESKNKKKLER